MRSSSWCLTVNGGGSIDECGKSLTYILHIKYIAPRRQITTIRSYTYLLTSLQLLSDYVNLRPSIW